MLRSLTQLAPRAVYVSANTTTASGLTVTLAKETRGDVALEAGALVLADQGLCCVDEFDKIGCDSHCLLEAMEQQQVSIAKSGVVASLSARCSIAAAANPVGGHYDCSRTISENLKMSAALLSRFDLVFILLDKPDCSTDQMLSEHIMRVHSLAPSSFNPHRHSADHPLLQRLERCSRSTTFSPIPSQIFKKYVTYARKFVHPKLSGPAATVLQNLYLKVRQRANGGNSLPITTRQLESLVRLAQTRARTELRDRVSEQDALDVVALLEHSLLMAFQTEHGSYDFARRGMSLAKQAKTFVAELHRICDRKNCAIFRTSDLHEAAKQIGLIIPDFMGFLEMLNDQSYLLKKGPKLWQVQTHMSTVSQHNL